MAELEQANSQMHLANASEISKVSQGWPMPYDMK